MKSTMPLQKALIYIERNLENRITLKNLAIESGYSEYHFHRLFQSALGETVMEYIRRKRIFHAAQDLLNMDSTIMDIALKNGFESYDVFTRAFKRFLGVTPSRYRKINSHKIPLIKSIPEEETRMFDYAVYEKMTCRDEEKRKCIPLIDFILKLSEKARNNGLLALETSAEGHGFFFRKTLELVLGGVEPVNIRNMMSNYILTGNYKGLDLLERVLTLEGLLAIQGGEHPMLLSERLLSWLGEELSQEVEALILKPYRPQEQFVDNFIENVKHKKPMATSTALLEDPVARMDYRSLQRILRDVTVEDITCALMGAGGNTITRILECLPVKTKAVVINGLDTGSLLSPQIIVDAQNRIINTILKLRSDGEIK